MVGCLGVLLAALGGWQWVARQQFLQRGWPDEFPAPIADTGLPPVCVNAALEQYEGERLDWALGLIAEGGITWVRQRFPWSELEPEPGVFDWAPWDRLVASAVNQGVQLIAVLDSPPAWAGMPPDPEAFARFAGAFANHYLAQLSYYELWRNPNLGDTWGGQANPYAYAELLAHAAPAIRAADPEARIILGSLAPNVENGPVNYSETRFLEILYATGAAPYFDVVSVQPYGFNTGPEDRQVEPELLNFSRPILIHEFLVAHGEGDKALWASDFGWDTAPPDPQAPLWGKGVDEATQAAYLTGALTRAEQEWPWMGVLCINNFQPRPATAGLTVPDAEEHWGFALVGPDGQPRAGFQAVQAWATRERVAGPGVYPGGTPFATFEGSWRLGPLGADIGVEGPNRATLIFEGTGVALTVRRGPYQAFLFVTVDGKPAPALPRDEQGRAFVVLYDPLAAIATVPLAEQLPYGRHTVTVTADRGWYQWALADWRVTDQPDPTPFYAGLALWGLLGVAGSVLAVSSGRRVTWRAVAPRLTAAGARLGAAGQVVLTTGVGIVFAFAAWQTWAQGAFRRLGEGTGLAAVLLAAVLFYFSPWLILALGSGAILFLLVFLQPELGLALTIAAAPFYLYPLSLFGKTFSLSELVLLPTLAGWAVAISGQRSAVSGRPSAASDLWSVVCGLWSVVRGSVLAFVLVAIASTLQAEFRHEALRELRLVILEPVLFYVALVTLPMTRRERWRIVDFFILSAVIVAVIGLVQYFLLGDVITAEGGIRRLRSIYGSPNNVGLYLGRALPFLLVVAASQKESKHQSIKTSTGQRIRAYGRAWLADRRRVLYALALLPVGAALALSLSKGALLLGVPAALMMLGWLAGGRWRKVTLIALVVLVLALIPLFSTPRFASLLNPTQGTTFLRLALWRSAFLMARDHPLLGVGPDNFLYAYRTRYVMPSAWEEFNLSHPHNWLLDFAARLGLPGLAVFFWLQLVFWRRALPLRHHPDRETRVLALGSMGLMADLLAHGLVDASYFVVDLALVFFLALAMVQGGTADGKKGEEFESQGFATGEGGEGQ